MSSYRFLACDLVTGTVREEIPFRSIKQSHVRNGVGSFSAQAPMCRPRQRTTGEYGWQYGASYGTSAKPPKVTCSILDPGRTLIAHGARWQNRG